jgi:hypothetical protein
MKRDSRRGRKRATPETTWQETATLGTLLDRLRSRGHEALEDSSPMFRKADSKFTDRRNERKLRLLMCACCRRLWGVLPAPARKAVEAIERLVDAGLPEKERDAVESAAYKAVPQSVWGIEYHPDQAGRWTAAAYLQDLIGYTPKCLRAARATKPEKAAEERAQCDLLRDIFGNPFRPMAFDPTWRTDTAVALAKGMYESRDFGAMPILADALQDAGCDNADVLNHCRDEKQPHVRGCWVVDLVLGKS